MSNQPADDVIKVEHEGLVGVFEMTSFGATPQTVAGYAFISPPFLPSEVMLKRLTGVDSSEAKIRSVSLIVVTPTHTCVDLEISRLEEKVIGDEDKLLASLDEPTLKILFKHFLDTISVWTLPR